MAANANVNVTLRMDKNLKQRLQELLSNLGLDMTTYFTMSARQAVREQCIPFKVTMEVPNAETRKAMKDTIEGKGLSKEYSSFEEDEAVLEKVEEISDIEVDDENVGNEI